VAAAIPYIGQPGWKKLPEKVTARRGSHEWMPRRDLFSCGGIVGAGGYARTRIAAPTLIRVESRQAFRVISGGDHVLASFSDGGGFFEYPLLGHLMQSSKIRIVTTPGSDLRALYLEPEERQYMALTQTVFGPEAPVLETPPTRRFCNYARYHRGHLSFPYRSSRGPMAAASWQPVWRQVAPEIAPRCTCDGLPEDARIGKWFTGCSRAEGRETIGDILKYYRRIWYPPLGDGPPLQSRSLPLYRGRPMIEVATPVSEFYDLDKFLSQTTEEWAAAHGPRAFGDDVHDEDGGATHDNDGGATHDEDGGTAGSCGEDHAEKCE
jgi:hypothetical protein